MDTEELQIRRVDHKLYVDFQLCEGLGGPNPRVVHGSTVIRGIRLRLDHEEIFINLVTLKKMGRGSRWVLKSCVLH